MESFDYVVTGAGTAGSIVASRLAEDPAVSAYVIEAGPSNIRPYVYLPRWIYTNTDAGSRDLAVQDRAHGKHWRPTYLDDPIRRPEILDRSPKSRAILQA